MKKKICFEADEDTQIFKVALSGTSLTLTPLDADRIVTKGNAVILKSTTSHIEMTLTKAYLTYSNSNNAREFFGFDEESDVTGISTTNFSNSTNADSWYTLDGRKLDGKPTTKGLYIHSGRKVVIK